MPEPLTLRLEQLVLPEPVTAGMSPWVLFSLAAFYRGCNEHADPILVRHLTGDLYRVVDGRHRTVASIIAGRKTVLATIEEAHQ